MAIIVRRVADWAILGVFYDMPEALDYRAAVGCETAIEACDMRKALAAARLQDRRG